MRDFSSERLNVKTYGTRSEMGEAAAADIAACILSCLKTKEEISMIFAAAPSQNDMLEALCKYSLPWERIRAFHMDEYIGLSDDAPQRFATYLNEHIFDKVGFKEVNLIRASSTDAEEECNRYSALLKKYPVDIVCLGIGENGHIAFNDPHVASFNDERLVKVVDLDEKCRNQQVNDGCFKSIDEVPKYALTLTIPALTSAAHMFCVVPASTKAEAVKNTVYGEIGEWCPATVMRKHSHAVLYCDADSSMYLK